jgi:hypothetical protein
VPPFGTVFVTEFTRNKQTQSVKGDAAAETTTNLRIAKEYFSDESYASDGDLAVEIARPIPKHLLNKYDRQPVYAKVWEMPLWQTAEALGVKEDSLSAACVKLFLPTPSRGYWNRHENPRSSVPRPQIPRTA